MPIVCQRCGKDLTPADGLLCVDCKTTLKPSNVESSVDRVKWCNMALEAGFKRAAPDGNVFRHADRRELVVYIDRVCALDDSPNIAAPQWMLSSESEKIAAWIQGAPQVVQQNLAAAEALSNAFGERLSNTPVYDAATIEKELNTEFNSELLVDPEKHRRDEMLARQKPIDADFANSISMIRDAREKLPKLPDGMTRLNKVRSSIHDSSTVEHMVEMAAMLADEIDERLAAARPEQLFEDDKTLVVRVGQTVFACHATTDGGWEVRNTANAWITRLSDRSDALQRNMEIVRK